MGGDAFSNLSVLGDLGGECGMGADAFNNLFVIGDLRGTMRDGSRHVQQSVLYRGILGDSEGWEPTLSAILLRGEVGTL